MMKSVRLHGPEKLVYESIRKPSKPAADEVLIKVSAVGICGSDLHMYETANFTGASLNPPFILGHEFCGIVLECGGKSPMDGFHQPLSVGQRVAVEPNMPCEKCEWCKRGQPNLCPYHSFSGCSPVDGALCELMTVRARNCFPLPDHISDESGALLETLGVGIHSINLGHMRIGDSVGVFGCGPVGLILVKLAKLHGARKIFAFDLFPWRVEKALEWGADAAYLAKDQNVAKIIEEATGGRGLDVTFEAASAKETLRDAIDCATPGGRVVLVGIPNDDHMEIKHSAARKKGLTLSFVRRMQHTYDRAIELASPGESFVDLDDLVSHRFPMSKTPEAFALNVKYQDGVIKAVVLP